MESICLYRVKIWDFEDYLNVNFPPAAHLPQKNPGARPGLLVVRNGFAL
jgi:hypothetical protein